MADDSNEVNVKFGATIDDLKSKMEEVSGLFKNVAEKFALVAAAIAGGEAFKAFIDKAQEVTSETVKLSKALGVGSDEASAIRTAIEDVGGSADMYAGAFTRFSRQLANNGDTLKEYGVDVDGVRKGTVTGTEAFQQALSSVTQYKAGVDQNQAAMKLFGRNISDVQTLLKVTPALLEEARKKNEELNLNITTDSVNASKKYSLAMHDVHDVLEGIEKTIGEAVIPMFTSMAQKFSAWGPDLVAATKIAIDAFIDIWQTLRDTVGTIIETVLGILGDLGKALVDIFSSGGQPVTAMAVFRTVMETLRTLFIGIQVVVELFCLAVKTGFELGRVSVTSFMESVDRLFHLDWSGAKAAVQRGTEERNKVLADAQDKAFEIAAKGNEKIGNALGVNTNYGHEARGQTHTQYTPPGGDKTFTPVNKSADAEAAARRALLKAQAEADLALQKEYLREAQQIYDEAYANGLITTRDYYAAKLLIATQAIDAELATKRRELADTQQLEGDAKKPEAKLKFKAQEAQLEGQINVLLAQRANTIRENAEQESKAMKELADDAAQFAANQDKGQGEGRVSQQKAALDQLKALREISVQDAFEAERRIEGEAYEVTQKSLADRAALIKGNELEQQKARESLQLEAEAAERTHQDKLTQIDNAAEIERRKYSLEAQDSIQGNFTNMISSLLNGVTRLSDVFRNFAKSLTATFVDLISKDFAEQVFNVSGVKRAIDSAVGFVTDGIGRMVKTFLTGETQRTAAEQAGAATRKALAIGEATVGQTGALGVAAVVQSAEAAKTGAVVVGAETRELAETGAATQSTATTAATAISNIGAKAWEAAANVYAAIASIPYVGPFLAPAMAVAAGAAVLGFAAHIVSSEGGEYNVAEDRLNLVHKNETILPAPFAQGLRDLVGQGGLKPLSNSVNQIVQSLAPAASVALQAVTPGLRSPEEVQPQLGGQSSDVGKLVMRWMGDEQQNRSLSESPAAMSKFQSMAAGQPAAPWWRVPANPLGQIQAGATLAPTGAGPLGGAAGRPGDIHLHVSAVDAAGVKRLFLDNSTALAAAMRKEARNFPPS